MRLIWLIIVPLWLLANSSEVAIYKEILQSLFPKSRTITIYVDDKAELENLEKTGLSIRFTDDIAKARLLWLKYAHANIGDVPIFATHYSIIRKYPKRVIGGFYWKKGRPTIIFYKQRLLRYGFPIDKNIQPFLEETR